MNQVYFYGKQFPRPIEPLTLNSLNPFMNQVYFYVLSNAYHRIFPRLVLIPL